MTVVEQIDTPLVITRQDGPVFEIVLNRPEKRNAMNIGMMDALDAAIDQAEARGDVRVILVRGEGKGFSAGIDLLGFNEVIDRFGEGWQHNLFPLTDYYQRILNKFETATAPTILAAHGFCLGMAFELALACDFFIVAEGTRLGLPETRLGLIPDVGGTARLTRLIGLRKAKELILTGREIDPETAQAMGITNAVAPPDALLDRAHALADELIAAAPLAVSYAKRVINGVEDLSRGLQMEAWAQSVLIRSEDFATGAQAMMTRTRPEWRGK